MPSSAGSVSKKIVLRCVLAFGVAFAIAVWLFSGVYLLVGEHRGRMLFVWGISVGDEFKLAYTHSVNLSPVVDVFGWMGGEEMILRRSYFASLGAGMPHPSDFPSSQMLVLGYGLVLEGIDRPMNRLGIITDYIANQRVVLGAREASLAELAGSGASVTLEVRRMPRYTVFWY